MAFLVGYVSPEEKAELIRRGWLVEPAEYYNCIGDTDNYLLAGPRGDDEAVVIFVDNDLFSVMNGPDWDKGEPIDCSPYTVECWELIKWRDDCNLDHCGEDAVGHNMSILDGYTESEIPEQYKKAYKLYKSLPESDRYMIIKSVLKRIGSY